MPGSMPAARSCSGVKPWCEVWTGRLTSDSTPPRLAARATSPRPIVEALGGGKPPAQDERDHAAEGRHLPARHRMTGVRGQARVEDAHDLGMRGKALRERHRVRAHALHAEVDRLQPPQDEKGRMRVHAASQDLQEGARALDPLARSEEGAPDDVGVAGQGLGEAVHHEVGPEGERLLEHRGGEGVVHDHDHAVVVGGRRHRPRCPRSRRWGSSGSRAPAPGSSAPRAGRSAGAPRPPRSGRRRPGRAGSRARSAWSRRRANRWPAPRPPPRPATGSRWSWPPSRRRRRDPSPPPPARPATPRGRAGWGWRSACRDRAPRRPRGSAASPPRTRTRTWRTARRGS